MLSLGYLALFGSVFAFGAYLTWWVGSEPIAPAARPRRFRLSRCCCPLCVAGNILVLRKRTAARVPGK